MSLPTTKPAQLSIRSFFQAKTPKYAPPPSQSPTNSSSSGNNNNNNSSSNNNNNNNGSSFTASLAPPPPAAVPRPFAISPQYVSTGTSSLASSYSSQLAPPPTMSNPGGGVPPILSQPLSLPPEVTIRHVTPDDIHGFRRLNSLLLSVSYPDAFYARAADPHAGRFSRVITWFSASPNDGRQQEHKIIGGIVCRVEPDFVQPDSASPHETQVSQNLYIQSLCLLSPYRSMGLIAAALDDIVTSAVADPTVAVDAVTAHVWTDNEEGLHWYENRGFRRLEPAIKGYYLKLRPDSAWLVSRPVAASVRNALPKSPTPPPPRRQSPIPNTTTAAIMNLPPLSQTASPGEAYQPQQPMTSAARAPPTPPPQAQGSSSRSSSTAPRPNLPPTGQSYQNQRAATEWNDLPADMAPGLLAPPKKSPANGGSEPNSAASSRSSSAVRKKRDRAYPAAAYGS